MKKPQQAIVGKRVADAAKDAELIILRATRRGSPDKGRRDIMSLVKSEPELSNSLEQLGRA